MKQAFRRDYGRKTLPGLRVGLLPLPLPAAARTAPVRLRSGAVRRQWKPTERAVRVCVVASNVPCTFTIAPAVTSAKPADWFRPFM